MTASDERTLLRAVASERDGAWLCHLRREIPNALPVRILQGLHGLKVAGLVSQQSGAYDMSTRGI